RMQLPNGQKCRSLYSSHELNANAHRAHNDQMTVGNKIKFSSCPFFFKLQLESNTHPKPFALVSKYSPPDCDLLEASSKALYSCTYGGEEGLSVVEATTIKQVVVMIPHEVNGEEQFFMFEQPGNAVTDMGGFLLGSKDDEDMDG
ncbi:hypothetical protein EDB19DRAFT_1644902, partial [Suillus lakei]